MAHFYSARNKHAYNVKLGADMAFSGPLAKNPLHDHWLLWEPANDPVYELGTLAEYVDLPTLGQMREQKIDKSYAGLGRNCALFEQVRAISYAEVRKFWRPGGAEPFFMHMLKIAEAINNSFYVPLDFPEVRGVAKSVSRWTWRRFNPAQFRDLQAARGRCVGATKREQCLSDVLRLAAEGKSNRAIAREVGVNDKTVAAWLRRGSEEAI